MVIGIDLRALQTGHKYRGIGEVAKQTTNRILQLASQEPAGTVDFIFYEYADDDPKQLLDIPANLDYEVVKLGLMPENDQTASRLDKLRRHFDLLYGSPIRDSARSDVFVQFDYAFGVPTNTKTLLIKHDLIPYLFWDKYFESAWVPFRNKAARTTLRTLFNNYKFMRSLRRSLRDAHVIMSVSENTKRDIEKHFGVDPAKSKVARLGVDSKPAKTSQPLATAEHLPTKPYLLFVGAGDARRRVDDLVAAYNNLKAEGKDIQLVLVGENFQAPDKIPNPLVRAAVMSSSYQDDILTLGYVDDETKQRLFRQAVAYVYPTRYEGFGIPILEAMLLDCPVLVYRNSSVPEVGGDAVLYAADWQDLKRQAEYLLTEPPEKRQARTAAARQRAEQFTWDKTAKVLYTEILQVGA